MKLKDICSCLDEAFPVDFQEGYDNSGIQVGDFNMEVNAALLTLDVTGEVVDEAVRENCQLIVSHHPVIFGTLKKITGNTQAGQIILKAIRNNIAIYSSHTNLDSADGGVSFRMAGKAGLVNLKVMMPLQNRLLKLVVFIPEDHLQKVTDAVFDAGAGVIGNYDRCGFSLHGTGSYRAGEDTKPFRGGKGAVHFEKEVRFETILYSHYREKVISALVGSHPYEEVAYDLYPVVNDNIRAGLGCIGELPERMNGKEFLELLRKVFGTGCIRSTGYNGMKIKKVAMCGGAGAHLLGSAISAGADAFVTGDVKYHTFAEAEGKILLADCGHYETEKFSTEILYDLLIKKFPNFALRFSKVNTNPINYL